jgi:two-component sensor histidine kinase
LANAIRKRKLVVENRRLLQDLKKANEQLKQELAERKRAEEQIEASLKEKEVLLKEIHHRVKNNLQIISSLLSLQSMHVKDKGAVEMLRDSQSRVRSMALIHERLYKSEGLVKINLAEYIRDLSGYLLRSYETKPDAIRLKLSADDVLMSIDTAIPCGLILNELISNSLKHAFPGKRGGEIRIGFHSDDEDRFVLTVGDNGIGFPEDLDLRSTKSLGLQLVNALTDQLEGSIELDRRGGTEFKVTFAEPNY